MAKHPRYHIVIDCNEDTTTAFMFVDNECVKITKAKLSPKDKFSLRIGAETAFNRLFEKKEKEKKPFQIGDRVVCVGDTNPDTRNAHGTIKVLHPDGLIGVEFDNRIWRGHSLKPYTFTAWPGHGWWCTADTLRHEQEAK